MNIKNKLRNSLVRKIQQLPTDKLSEVNKLLNKKKNIVSSREETLKLAGAWRDLSDDLFDDLTIHLHENRAIDRQIL